MAETYNTGGYDAPITYKDKAVTNTVISVKSTYCNLLGWRITNPNSTTIYFKFFDKALANQVILGTTEPCKEFSVPALGEIFVYEQRAVSHYYFQNGLCIVAVNGLATSSTGTPILNMDVEIYYK